MPRSKPSTARSSYRLAVPTPPSGATPTSAANVTIAAAGEIRIIGGQWKRTRLKVPSQPGLRPTPDRVRETLFNWLGQDLSGWRCLDAFAGTGALGLEAASRGAAHVLWVEQDAALCRALEQHCRRLQPPIPSMQTMQVQRGDALVALRRVPAHSLHLVFLDPPFAQTALFAPALCSAAQAVATDGFVYLEAPAKWSEGDLASCGLQPYRYLKAGAVHAHVLRPLRPISPL